MTPPSLRSRLLVASPLLLDDSFRRSVVLVLEHSEDGAFGLVLDRPSELEVGEVLERWAPRVPPPSTLFVGGPVEPSTLLALGRFRPGSHPPERAGAPSWSPLFHGLGQVNLHEDPDGVDGLEELRIFAGCAGWRGGQLDDEVAAGAWVVRPSRPADVFDAEPTGLWRSVLRRAGGWTEVLARAPEDPDAC